MITRLKPHFRCIAPDYPGFGLSIPPPGFDFHASSHSEVMIEFVEKLELEDLLIVMQDWGGPVGRSIASLFNGVWRFFMFRGFINPRGDKEMATYAAPSLDASHFWQDEQGEVASDALLDWAPSV